MTFVMAWQARARGWLEGLGVVVAGRGDEVGRETENAHHRSGDDALSETSRRLQKQFFMGNKLTWAPKQES